MAVTRRLPSEDYTRYPVEIDSVRNGILSRFPGVQFEIDPEDECVIRVNGPDENVARECAKDIYDNSFNLVVRELNHVVEPGSKLDQYIHENEIWVRSQSNMENAANGREVVLIPPLRLGQFLRLFGDHVVVEDEDED